VSVLRAIAVGLIFDGVLALLSSFNLAMPKEAALQMTITLVGVVLLLAFKLNPLWLLFGAMALGAVLH
jgi:chromate transport protein ChrA